MVSLVEVNNYLIRNNYMTYCSYIESVTFTSRVYQSQSIINGCIRVDICSKINPRLSNELTIIDDCSAFNDILNILHKYKVD